LGGGLGGREADVAGSSLEIAYAATTGMLSVSGGADGSALSLSAVIVGGIVNSSVLRVGSATGEGSARSEGRWYQVGEMENGDGEERGGWHLRRLRNPTSNRRFFVA
jgi:hypothetical protein